MSQVLLFTSPYFRGTITDTPSGQAYHVVPGQTVVADSEDVALLTGLGFTAAAPSANPGSSLTLSDTNSHTVTNTSSIVVGSGGTVSGSGGIGTITGFGGGGGGSYSAGLGIDPTALAAGTIGNTGTIVQQAVTSGIGNGIALVASPVTNPGTDSTLYSAAVYAQAGNIYVTNPSGYAEAGFSQILGGSVVRGDDRASGVDLTLGGGTIDGSGRIGGGAEWSAGYGADKGGTNVIKAGNCGTSGVPGDLVLSGGYGNGYGVIIHRYTPNSDPHHLGAEFQAATANLLGFFALYRSQG